LYPLHNNSSAHLTTITEVRRSGRITDGMRKEWRALRDPVLSSSTHLAEIALPSTAWVRLNRLRTVVTRFRSSLHKRGMAVWVWRRSNRWLYCLAMSMHRPPNGLHGSGWWDNRLAVQHLARVLVRPSSGLKELAQTMMLMKQLVLACCRHSYLNQPHCAVFICVK